MITGQTGNCVLHGADICNAIIYVFTIAFGKYQVSNFQPVHITKLMKKLILTVHGRHRVLV